MRFEADLPTKMGVVAWLLMKPMTWIVCFHIQKSPTFQYWSGKLLEVSRKGTDLLHLSKISGVSRNMRKDGKIYNSRFKTFAKGLKRFLKILIKVTGWLGWAMVLGSFHCRDVLLLLHIVGQGPAVLAAGAGRVGYIFFIYLPFLMSCLLGDGWPWLKYFSFSC